MSLSSLPPSVEYDAQTLRNELIALGCSPGPIMENTKHLYLKKLHALKKRNVVVEKAGGKCEYYFCFSSRFIPRRIEGRAPHSSVASSTVINPIIPFLED